MGACSPTVVPCELWPLSRADWRTCRIPGGRESGGAGGSGERLTSHKEILRYRCFSVVSLSPLPQSPPFSLPWHGACYTLDIVKSVRSVLSAVALIVAFVGASIVPAYAGQARPACGPPAATAAHECCKTPILKACCTNRSDQSRQSGPTQPRVQVNPNFTAVPPIFVVDLASAFRTTGAIQPTPPRAGPLDLPTLLSTLLI